MFHRDEMHPLDRYEAALDAPSLADWAEIAAELAAALRKPARKQPAPVSALSFIVAHGGIRDDGGELRSMDAHKLRPGLVNNRSGRSADHIRELLVEAGYLIESGPDEPARTTIDDVWGIVRDGLAGRHIYPGAVPF